MPKLDEKLANLSEDLKKFIINTFDMRLVSLVNVMADIQSRIPVIEKNQMLILNNQDNIFKLLENHDEKPAKKPAKKKVTKRPAKKRAKKSTKRQKGYRG